MLSDGLALQTLHVEAVGFGGEDEEGHDRGSAVAGLEEVVESGQRLQEQVSTLVGELIPTYIVHTHTYISKSVGEFIVPSDNTYVHVHVHVLYISMSIVQYNTAIYTNECW